MKNTNRQSKETKQDGSEVKKKDERAFSDHSPAVANTVSDAVKNTASETDGLNQQKTDKNDLEPGTHNK